MSYPKPVHDLIEAFSTLPSVGPRTAERYVFYLLKSGKRDAAELTNALKGLIAGVKSCEICWNFADRSPCAICSDKSRDPKMVCVVAEPQDLEALERLHLYRGRYHVLRGTFSGEEESLAFLKIRELLERVRGGLLSEIILSLNHDMRGEMTMMYLEREIKKIMPTQKVTRLARGLPMGSDLLYADDITLGSALAHRTESK